MARKVKNKKIADVKARYDAAGTGRRLSGWNTPSSGPNTAITGLQKIRDRIRDAVRNEWSAAANVRVWTNNLIGTGVVPRPKTKNVTLKQKINDLWNAWVKDADADGILDFYGMQMLVARSWFTSGECFIRTRPRRMSDGIEVPLQFQILEADMCPLFDYSAYPGMPEGNYIRQGIEIDRIGRRVAYWMYREHPGDRTPVAINPQMLSRIPADQIFHIFEPMRPGQLRGVSELASIILKLKNVSDFDDALLERQHLANLFTLFVTKAVPSGSNDPMTGLPAGGTLDEPLAGLEPGLSVELLPGEDVKFSDPPDAGASYAEFMRTQHLGVAAGTGTPYELITGDLKDVSDRTLRIIINEFRRLCEQKMWLLFIPQFLRKVRDTWADFALIGGVMSASDAAEAKNVQWSPQGWAYIHPVQDVQAKQLEVEAGFRSRASVISDRGDDPDEVDQERADDKDREDKLGLTPEPPPPAVDPKQQADQKAQKDKAAKAQLAIQNRILDLLDDSND